MKVTLVLFRADGDTRTFKLPSGATTIGRGDDCRLKIPLSNISRHHCEVTVDEATSNVTVRDLGSSNGTFVNSKRVETGKLTHGDRLSLGPVMFGVQITEGDESFDQVQSIDDLGGMLMEDAFDDPNQGVSGDIANLYGRHDAETLDDDDQSDVIK